MKSLRRVGIEVLAKLLYHKNDPAGNYWREVEVAQDILDIGAISSAHHYFRERSVIDYKAGAEYSVWGMELGYKVLPNTQLSLLESMARLKFVPSHLVLRAWSSDDISDNTETYTIYPLTPEQRREIRERQAQFAPADLSSLDWI